MTGTTARALGVDVSPTLIPNVTEAAMDEVSQWQNRPLEPVYPIMYVDYLVVNVRENQQGINKSLYLALAVTLEGHEERWACGWLSAPDSIIEVRGERFLHCLYRWTYRLTRI